MVCDGSNWEVRNWGQLGPGNQESFLREFQEIPFGEKAVGKGKESGNGYSLMGFTSAGRRGGSW